MSSYEHRVDVDRELKYRPFVHEDAIRLISLGPAADQGDKLRASLSVARLGNLPQYEAISYTWGAADCPERLWLPDGFILISTNLASALKHLRLPDTPRLLWADAICIDQTDLAEKSIQVTLMGQIYEKAMKVVIWLGAGDDRTHQAVEGFHDIGNAIKGQVSASGSALPDQDPLPFPEEFDIILNKPTVLFSRYGSFRPDIKDTFLSYEMHHIYQNDWFTRLWIVQEVSLASEAVIHCGSRKLPWPCFAAVMMLYKHAVEELHIRNPAACKYAWAVIETRALHHFLRNSADGLSKPSRNYVSLIESLRGQGCSDDRDKVYGLLSLQTPELAARLRPDYSKQVNAVYIDYVRESLAQGNVDALYYAGTWYREEFSGETALFLGGEYIPTWVPDFRKGSCQDSLPWLKFAAQSTKPVFGKFRFDQTKAEEGTINLGVHLRGFILDDVIDGHAAVSSKRTAIYTANQRGPFGLIRAYVNDCLEIFRRHSKGPTYATQEPQMNAFWRLMAMDALSPNFRQRLATDDPNSTYVPSFGQLFERQCLRSDARLVKENVLVDLMLDAPGEFNYEQIFSLEERGALLYYDCLREILDSVCFIVTEQGLIGLAPPSVRPGDVIVIVIGAHFPFVARQVPGAEFLLLIGPCYIHGLMNGIASMRGDPNSVGLISFL